MINCFPMSSSSEQGASHYRENPKSISLKIFFAYLFHHSSLEAEANFALYHFRKNISFKQKGKSIIICKKVKKFLFFQSFFYHFDCTFFKKDFALVMASLAILLCACFSCTGCLRQDAEMYESHSQETPGFMHSSSGKVKSFISGSLRLPAETANLPTLYIDVHDAKGQQLLLPSQLERQARSAFEIVDNPSKARHILHVTILDCGTCSESELKKVVESGFGSSSSLFGTGGSGLVADVLLVTRRVPDDKKERTVFLKNVSARNALESAQMRLGIFTKRSLVKETIKELEMDLAMNIDEALRKR